MLSSESSSIPLYALLLSIPVSIIYYRQYYRQKPEQTSKPTSITAEKPLQTIMQAAREDLAPPKDDPFTLEELKQFSGSDASKPIYVAIKGTVFDVSHKADVYGPGKSYNIFAGKDGSKGLGKSSLKPEDAVPDYSDLPEADMKVLNDWHAFFSKRYNVVGKVTDHPVAVASL